MEWPPERGLLIRLQGALSQSHKNPPFKEDVWGAEVEWLMERLLLVMLLLLIIAKSS